MTTSALRTIALGAALFASPAATTVAFTSSSSSATRGRASSRTTPLRASPSEEGGSAPRRPFPLSASQEERLRDFVHLPSPPPESRSSSTHGAAAAGVDDDVRSSEFSDLEPLPSPTPERLARLASDERTSRIYVPSGSDSYWDLRDEIDQLERDLESAIEVGVSEGAADSIRGLLRKARARDPEHVHRVTSGAARSAERMGRSEEGSRYREESLRARRMLPQFNLEGLWVGKYGSHGFEMINVTYSGDQLIAYKVTGDKNIPRGEISFTADLSPPSRPPSSASYGAPGIDRPLPGAPPKLDPIVLSDASAKKWGTRRLPRFPGQGHAAEPGYVNHQYLEGQLVVIGDGDYFSFAWVPLEHQIFFGRPSPELTLKMLREGGGTSLTAGTGLAVPGEGADRRAMADYAARCLEVTCDAMWDERAEGKADPESCIWHGDDEEHCYFE
ncbi:hypothetical protein ACHAWF_007209 [Thalassiosira exigua]